MASKKTSEENVLTKSGFNANTVMRLADGSTNDNYQIGCLDFINAITLTSAQAITLLGTPSDVVLDSMYKITTLGITGVDEVIISGRNMIAGNSFAQCLVHDSGVYVPCTYDVATNKINLVVSDYGILTQTGTSAPALTILNKNIIGVTYTVNYNDVGLYAITPSPALIAVLGFTYATAEIQGVMRAASGDILDPFAHAFASYYSALDEIKIATQLTDGTLTDVLLNETPIKISVYIKN